MKESDAGTRINSKHDWKDILYVVIFRATTPAGKRFDVWLLIAIVISVLIVLADSVPAIHVKHGEILYVLEWVFTLLFTIEYIIRIIILERKKKYIWEFPNYYSEKDDKLWQEYKENHPDDFLELPYKKKYIFSVMGIIDLVSIIPTYLSIFLIGYQYLIVLRSLRLLRIFKILKLRNFQIASSSISLALYSSYRKILIFMMFISLLVVIIGSVMYIVEVDTPGFESIPHAIYWAVVTITTVGYGDVSPATSMGKFFSIIVMLCGYSIIAVPTGIVTMEMARAREMIEGSKKECTRCGKRGLPGNARYCYRCGEKLDE